MKRSMEELVKRYDTFYSEKENDEEQEHEEILYTSDIQQLFDLSGENSNRLTAEDRLFSMCGNAWKAGVITGYQCGCRDAEKPNTAEIRGQLYDLACDIETLQNIVRIQGNILTCASEERDDDNISSLFHMHEELYAVVNQLDQALAKLNDVT